MARVVVVVFQMYRNLNSLSTLYWIDSYLRGLGAAGVFLFRSRVEMESYFDSDEYFSAWTNPNDLLISLTDLERPMIEKYSLPIRRAAKSAIRIIEATDSENSEEVKWANKRASLQYRETDPEDIYDGV